MSARPLPPEADANQARASDPSASAWVSANAGTGKTEVLVRRSLRLLLAGSRPESILCLTYTKTAAAEMQNRLLDRLSDWATTSPDKLDEDLTALLRRAPDESEAAHRAAPIRPRARGQRRPQDPHHPRLLRAAVAALSARIASDAAFLGAGRARAGADAPRRLRRRGFARRRGQRQRARQGASCRDRAHERGKSSRSDRRRVRQARRARPHGGLSPRAATTGRRPRRSRSSACSTWPSTKKRR